MYQSMSVARAYCATQRQLLIVQPEDPYLTVNVFTDRQIRDRFLFFYQERRPWKSIIISALLPGACRNPLMNAVGDDHVKNTYSLDLARCFECETPRTSSKQFTTLLKVQKQCHCIWILIKLLHFFIQYNRSVSQVEPKSDPARCNVQIKILLTIV